VPGARSRLPSSDLFFNLFPGGASRPGPPANVLSSPAVGVNLPPARDDPPKKKRVRGGTFGRGGGEYWSFPELKGRPLRRRPGAEEDDFPIPKCSSQWGAFMGSCDPPRGGRDVLRQILGGGSFTFRRGFCEGTPLPAKGTKKKAGFGWADIYQAKGEHRATPPPPHNTRLIRRNSPADGAGEFLEGLGPQGRKGADTCVFSGWKVTKAATRPGTRRRQPPRKKSWPASRREVLAGRGGSGHVAGRKLRIGAAILSGPRARAPPTWANAPGRPKSRPGAA